MFCDAVHYVTFTFWHFLFRMLTLCAATISNIQVMQRLRCGHLRYVATLLKYLNSLMRMQIWTRDSGIFLTLDPGSGTEKIRIRDKHLGSAILILILNIWNEPLNTKMPPMSSLLGMKRSLYRILYSYLWHSFIWWKNPPKCCTNHVPHPFGRHQNALQTFNVHV